MSSATFDFTGHLFDTKFFNIALDILEQHGVKFRVVDLSVGNTTGEPSRVTVQIISKDKAAFNQAIEKVQDESEKSHVEITEAMSGPSIEKALIRTETSG